jgi:hypothetical protein
MNALPMLRSTLRGHARGRDLLRAAGRNALPGRICALVYIFKRAALKTADSGMISRRRRDEESTSRRSDGGATVVPRHSHADGLTFSRWFLGIVALAPRRCRACASVSLRWRLGIDDIVALVHRLLLARACQHSRLSIAALARCERGGA